MPDATDVTDLPAPGAEPGPAAVPDRPLLPLPVQPEGVPWPTSAWPTATPGEVGADATRLDGLLEDLFEPDPHPELGRTYGVAVVAGGRLITERYGHRTVQDLRALGEDPPTEPLDASSELLSWSMAKSLTHLLVGVAVDDGALAPTDPVPEPMWSAPGDPRASITWDDLLSMRPGLAWTEEYYDLVAGELPDVITMLFGAGAMDMGAYAADKPLVAEPGSTGAYCYSSGTTNIVTRNLQRVLGLDATGTERFLRERLLDPIGMTSARPQFDAAGTFTGSSYVHATLRDWCRLGLLALRGGTWEGRALVPEGWVDHGRLARSATDTPGLFHGAHWWTWDQDQQPFGAHGFEGQRAICFPTRDVVVVRAGKSASEAGPALNARITEIAACFLEI